jgi:hypothetical protein
MDQDYFRKVAEFLGATYSHPFGERGAMLYSFALGGSFFLTDNGGEINVHGFNRTIDLPSIPTEPSFNGVDRNVGPATAAMRIHVLMKGGTLADIDYTLNVDDLV